MTTISGVPLLDTAGFAGKVPLRGSWYLQAWPGAFVGLPPAMDYVRCSRPPQGMPGLIMTGLRGDFAKPLEAALNEAPLSMGPYCGYNLE